MIFNKGYEFQPKIKKLNHVLNKNAWLCSTQIHLHVSKPYFLHEGVKNYKLQTNNKIGIKTLVFLTKIVGDALAGDYQNIKLYYK